jgi:DNA-binding MarR family transcriptional regulator
MITDIIIDQQADSRPEDAELAILESIYSSQKSERPLTQRDLAEAAGLSLGMTNALLKRFAEKGWVLLRRLNARTIHYALSPEGVNEIAHRTYRYFKRSARNASMYRDLIEAFVMKAKREGVGRIVLAGSSDLDFILEFACERHGVLFVKGVDAARAARLGNGGTTLMVEAEDGTSGLTGAVSLASVLVGRSERYTAHKERQ